MKRWKNRLTNYNFWVSLVSAVILILQAFDLKFDIAHINEIVTAVLGLLVVIGIINDPTRSAETSSKEEKKLAEQKVDGTKNLETKSANSTSVNLNNLDDRENRVEAVIEDNTVSPTEEEQEIQNITKNEAIIPNEITKLNTAEENIIKMPFEDKVEAIDDDHENDNEAIINQELNIVGD